MNVLTPSQIKSHLKILNLWAGWLFKWTYHIHSSPKCDICHPSCHFSFFVFFVVLVFLRSPVVLLLTPPAPHQFSLYVSPVFSSFFESSALFSWCSVVCLFLVFVCAKPDILNSSDVIINWKSHQLTTQFSLPWPWLLQFYFESVSHTVPLPHILNSPQMEFIETKLWSITSPVSGLTLRSRSRTKWLGSEFSSAVFWSLMKQTGQNQKPV